MKDFAGGHAIDQYEARLFQNGRKIKQEHEDRLDAEKCQTMEDDALSHA